ncbi:GNAT family N-acetyltransferase [Bowmanella denitrificans]|uniref:tRNA(Met) cytidine acetyltransferase TmcA n=1 Tax=Bowmanella denitrificans TaxID=366582 RepID=A0ABN0XJI0_9ALTE
MADVQNAFQSWLNQRYSGQFHRQLLLIQGPKDWTRQQAASLLSHSGAGQALWIGDEPGQVSCRDYRRQLGNEWDTVVFDLFAGVSASALVALSGTVRRGGLMLLLCPAQQELAHFIDPKAGQKNSFGWPVGPSQFCRWLLDRVSQSRQVAVFTPEAFRGNHYPADKPSAKPGPCASPEQALAVQGIVKVAKGHRHRPLVITADRGRGKSSALGIAAAQLIRDSARNIVITAPHPDAVAQAFTQAAKLLPEANQSKDRLQTEHGELRFVPVDVLLREAQPADVLLVDEAAAIPAPLLKKLLGRYSRVVFASTIHGYEGSGRGFEIRFKPYLRAQRPGWQQLHLSTPLRWSPGDCLEAFWFDALLMRDAPATEASQTFTAPKLHWYSGPQLASQPSLLHKVFDLLVNAHYQTSPDDLQRILDAPDIQVVTLQQEQHLLAAMLVQTEGTQRLADLANPISLGQRRVQGHLLAQNLSAYLCEPALASLSYLRIVRIAVKDNLRRLGLGRQMLKQLTTEATLRDYDALGSSFGASPDLLAFWQHSEFMPVRLGHKQDAASGEHSLLVLKALSPKAQIWQCALTSYFYDEYPYLLATYFKQLDASLALSLLKGNRQDVTLNVRYQRQLQAFSVGTQPLDTVLQALRCLLMNRVKLPACMDTQLAMRYLLQGWDIGSVCQEAGLSGKKQLVARLRSWVKARLDATP